jgi:sucrose phosphorylase
MFALAGMPGIYVHSLFGSRGDRAAGESSGIPRRINRQKLELNELENDLASASSLRSRVFGEMRRLLQVRAAEPAFTPVAPQQVLDIDPRIFAVERTNEMVGKKVFCLHNVSANPVEFPFTVPGRGAVLNLLTGAVKNLASQNLQLKPYEIMWLTRQEPGTQFIRKLPT